MSPTAPPLPMRPRTAVLVADQLQQYLDRVLGGPVRTGVLYSHIRAVSVGLHVAAIHTDLSSGEHDRAAAEQICLIASWFRRSPEGRHVTALDVEVYGQNGDVIAAYDDTAPLASMRGQSRVPRPGPAGARAAGATPLPTPGQPAPDSGRNGS